jgi:DNA-binding NarL/FixJ family response regulator
VGVLAGALARGHEGECVVDPAIVSRLLRRARPARPLGVLTGCEREVLALMAEGCSNKGICERLTLSAKTVEGHMRNVFTKLVAGESGGDHRRVLAVPSYLRSAPQQA